MSKLYSCMLLANPRPYVLTAVLEYIDLFIGIGRKFSKNPNKTHTK